uniref:Striatin N-terminal domain-containing protein n=1 Tax=Denticeps clupeoides TaxID=299321 RepID=A0AAY4A4F1_9TELE
MDEQPAGGGGPAAPPQGSSSLSPALMLQPPQQDEPPRPQQYTIPGILHYIQHEWARFEMERAHWEVERAELQARIAFLQGERKGQENLKNDLVRRIKMLEYALKQERAKYHKLKYGTELNQGEVKMPSFESDSDAPAVPQNSQLTWKQGRQLLRQYLQEVGYTDTILDVRGQRVRSLLGLSGSEQNGSVESKNLEQILNGGESPVGNEGLASDLPDDPDTEEALKEFDFLVNAEDGEGAGEARSSGDGTEWGKSPTQTLAEMTGPSSAVMAGLGGIQTRPRCVYLVHRDLLLSLFPFSAEPLPFTSGGGKSFLLGSEDVLDSVLGLGDLADLTVANDEADYSYDLPANKDAFRKTWNPKYTLRSHFDGVRALAFHPVEPVLVTVSEDHTLKLWNLQKTVPAKKSASFDVEPIYTFRAHVGAVLSLAVSSSGEQCFSGGIDSTIQWWNIPSSNVDPYDTYDPSTLAGTLLGHTDAVWGLAYSGIKNRLLSCSADGTVRLWNPPEKNCCLNTYNSEKEHGVPTAVDFNGCDPAHMVASFNTGNAVVYDMETSQPTVVFAAQALPAGNHINKVVSHPTLPVTVTAHEDRHIKFFDNKSGKLIHAMVAHLDAVTSLAVDPNGIYLMSGSHDCSIRLWNLDSKTCVQEITAHRKKSDESIYDVAFHPSKAFIASAGADALAKVFV